MKSVLKIKEIQLGLIILITLYCSMILSKIDLFMTYEYLIIIITTLMILICLLLNLRIIVDAPHRGQLVITHKEDEWFIVQYKILFFIILYTVFTFFIGLVVHSLPTDRTHNIFLLSLYITNIYYLIVSFWLCYSFIQMSTVGDNLEYKNDFQR